MGYTKVDWEKSAQARQQMEFSDSFFWKPKAGNGVFEENFVRILPPHEKMEAKVFQPMSLHWMPDKTAYVCPRRMLGGRCALCDKGFEVLKLDGKQAARKFWPNWTAYLNILVLNRDGSLADEGVKLWSANTDVTDLLLELKNEVGDFADPDTGRDLMIKCKKNPPYTDPETGRVIQKYDYIIRANPRPSPLRKPELLADLHDPTAVNPLLSPADMQRLVTMLIEGPGAERADPLALPPAQEDAWGEDGGDPVAQVLGEAPQGAVDPWGGEDTSPPPPSEPKAKRGRKAAVSTAEDIEAQKERLRRELRS